jgi:hypothetical protein
MPYTINRTNGAKITVVNDGTINSSALDITLIGKNYTGYGETFNENFVKLLENFSNTTRPAKPLTGQLYFNSTTKKLEVYTTTGATKWKTLGVMDVQASKPSGANPGDLWFNPQEAGGRLYAYTGVGTEWVLVGPLTSRAGSSGAISIDVINQDTTLPETVLKLESNGAISFIASTRPAFDVDVSEAGIVSDFTVIKQGITLPGTDSDGVSYDPSLDNGYLMWGTAGTSLGLVRSNGDYITADAYLTQAELSGAVGTITINEDLGIVIGQIGVLKLHITDPDDTANISVVGGNASTLRFNVGTTNTSSTQAGDYYNIFSITTGTNNNPKILPNSTATVFLGTASQAFSYGFINTVTSTTIRGTEIYDSNARVVTTATIGANGVSSLAGTANKVTVNQSQGAVTVSLPNTLDITVQSLRSTGSSQVFGAWILGTGATFQATYADLAERYHADQEYCPGTVLVVGGTNEVTVTADRASTAVAGIVSTNPAYTLNAEAGNDTTHPYIALKGRVPCQVIGPITKGDLLVTSSHKGYAEKIQDGDNANAVLGRALSNFDGDKGVIEVMIV